MRLSLTLAPDATAPARARTSVRALALGVSPPVLRDVQLVVSELVTNAVEYGPCRGIRIELELLERDHVRGEVIDEGAEGVAPDPALEPGSEHLGLQIVDRITSRWGVTSGSTHVWFELAPRR